MITKLRISFKNENCTTMNHNSSSLMHGVLMERVSPEYGDYLHRSVLKPFSQHLIKEAGQWAWEINTLNQDACANIIEPILSPAFESIYIRHKDITLYADKKEILEDISHNDFVKRFYMSSEHPQYVNMQLITPIAFKQDGRYTMLPDMRLFFQSIMRKYDAMTTCFSLYDEETLNTLTQNCLITDYKLMSDRFHLESTRIPGFRGEMTLRVNGASSLKNLTMLLLHYGTFSGVGIKSSLGMGAIAIRN